MRIERKVERIKKSWVKIAQLLNVLYYVLTIYCFTIVIGTHILGGQTEQLTGGVTVAVSSQPLASKILIDFAPLLNKPAAIGELGVL